MLRIGVLALRVIRPLTSQYYRVPIINSNDFLSYGAFNVSNSIKGNCFSSLTTTPSCRLSGNQQILEIANKISPANVRTVTKFSLKKGKRKTCKQVIKRFFRLHWGAWIRPKIGRHKRLWTKSEARKRRLRQHVFCTATQTTLLDKMVTKFWHRPKYYVDDPYEPYHTREEFETTKKKPHQ